MRTLQMRAVFLSILPLCSCAFVGGRVALLGGAARARSTTPVCTVDQKILYEKIDTALRRGKREGAPAFRARTARAISQRWLEMPPADLVEATLVSGALLLTGFDEGLDILLEAEEKADLTVSSKGYYALCRLAVAEERPQDVLYVLGRASSRGVDRTDGLLLSGMQAAASMEDWGAVARLYAELSMGTDAAAVLAAELESLADPGALADMQRALGAPAPLEQLADDRAEALTLALRAHCERGDLVSVRQVLDRMRAREVPLGVSEYLQVAALTRRMARPDALLALRPMDLARSIERSVEPPLFALQSRVVVLSTALGTTERAIVASLLAGMAGTLIVGAVIASLGGALGSTAPPDDLLNF